MILKNKHNYCAAHFSSKYLFFTFQHKDLDLNAIFQNLQKVFAFLNSSSTVCKDAFQLF